LELISTNEPAARLYRSVGFVEVGEVADLFRIDGQRCPISRWSSAWLDDAPANQAVADGRGPRLRSEPLLEDLIQAALPPDMRCFCLAVDGMKNEFPFDSSVRVLPIDEVVPVGSEYPGYQPSDALHHSEESV